MSALNQVVDIDYQPTDVAVVLFDIQSHVSIDGHEPSLDEAKRLYLRWFGTAPDPDTGWVVV